MGKISSDDIRPILDKFNELTGKKANKITSADVSGPIRKKKNENPEDVDGIDVKEKLHASAAEGLVKSTSSSGALKKIAQAFKEEVLTASNQDKAVIFREEEEKEKSDAAIDYSDFCIPPTTHALAIDDSKIQRKLLGKIFENAGIPSNKCTICGDGYSEIMGFEDYVVKFMGSHDGYVFMIVDENLDFMDETTGKHDTISGSQCVENIRKRLPPEVERRMLAVIRSANDSSSDVAIYNTRAHAFLPKAPIKPHKVKETIAPIWINRFGKAADMNMGENNTNELATTSSLNDSAIGCTPYDVEHLIGEIDTLFQKDAHINEPRVIQEKMHELKGDLLTLNSNMPVHSLVGQINSILTTQAPETLFERWSTLRDDTNEIIQSLQKKFKLPGNTYAIAIDDSKIQRKLLGKFFDFLAIPSEKCTVMGDGTAEIMGFETFVVEFMENHKEDYVLMIVDENLDTADTSISGSTCVENIRKKLLPELEKRMLIVIRSANDSLTEIATFNERAHAFLPKAPVRREKVLETIAPMWMKRFPASDFEDSADFDMTDETVATSQTDELACTPYDIAQKLVDIEGMFMAGLHVTDMRRINDQLHELKGDLLTLTSDASIISSLGMINLMLLRNEQPPEVALGKWHNLRDRIYEVVNAMESEGSIASPSNRNKSFLSRLTTSSVQ